MRGRRAITRVSEGWSALWVSPSCGAPPLLGAIMDTRHAHDVHPYSTSPLRPLGLSYPPGPPPGSLSAGRAAAAEPAFPSYASSAAAPPPSRLFCLVPLTPPPAIPRPTPQAKVAALGRVAPPPREVGPALPGRRVDSGKLASFQNGAPNTLCFPWKFPETQSAGDPLFSFLFSGKPR